MPILFKSTSCYTHLCRRDDNHVFSRLVGLDLFGLLSNLFGLSLRWAVPTTPDVVILRVVFDCLL
jgi:hypothetical protein